jgi:hypothetical protein
MVEGKIVNVSGAKVTLADGTELMIPSTVKVQRADLKPGATVKASFEERGGQAGRSEGGDGHRGREVARFL